eukprot:jgi/Orpsp1_1/1191933/evm.model.d7180000089482.1
MKVSFSLYLLYNSINFRSDGITNTLSCPENSSFNIYVNFETRTGEKYDVCDYQYYCHKNENCIKLNSSTGLNDPLRYGEFVTNLDNKDEKIIQASCNEKSIKEGSCSTDKCTVDADCFSNKCKDNICVTDDDNPSYICRTMKENSEFKVKCLLNYEKKCNNDLECANEGFCRSDK